MPDRSPTPPRPPPAIAATAALLALAAAAACAPSAPAGALPAGAAPPSAARGAAGRAAAVAEAHRCGRVLGIAARCNLMRDERDFAVVRFAALQGLRRRHGSSLPEAELGEALDLAALDRLTTVNACRIPPADLPRVEAGVRGAVAACAAP